jgi:rhodanese-related sulfurtransferase
MSRRCALPILALLSAFSCGAESPAGTGGSTASTTGATTSASGTTSTSTTSSTSATTSTTSTTTTSSTAPATLGVITVAELSAELAAKDFVMIDVHIPHAGVVPGTDASIAYTDPDAIAAFVGADLDRKVVLTCLGGPMSVTAGDALVARGYRAVRWLQGGMNAWTAAGYALDP